MSLPGVQWFLGTMGYGYKDWQNGVFYPAGMPARQQLHHYSQVFNAVEMDTTFYAIPTVDQVRRWAAQTPETFIFCPKTPREITHDLRLHGAEKLMHAFVDAVRFFEQRLGPILIQLPPDFTRDEYDQLTYFLGHLPAGARYAVEFRHRSWHATETGVLLQAHHAAWVSADYIHLPQRIYKTTDFLFIRWIGQHGRFEEKTHVRIDRRERLQNWWADIQERAEGVSAIYGFFNNDYAGFSPATCNLFKEIAGLPAKPVQPPHQGRLL